jgi:hypothetical protein
VGLGTWSIIPPPAYVALAGGLVARWCNLHEAPIETYEKGDAEQVYQRLPLKIKRPNLSRQFSGVLRQLARFGSNVQPFSSADLLALS